MTDEGLALIKDFFKAGTLQRFRRGEILLQAGTEPAGIYYLEKGFVKVYSIRKSGVLNLHIIFKTGEIFPLIWAFRGRPSQSFYEAMDDVTVRRLSRQQFRNLIFTHPAAARFMIEQLAELHWIYANRVENLELGKARERVVFRLVTLMERFGHLSRLGEVVIEAPITQQDIADSLNMIRETASREIEKLEQDGIIIYRNHNIVVTDPVRLKAQLAWLRD